MMSYSKRRLALQFMLLLICSGVLVVLDQYSKQLALHHLKDQEDIIVWKGILSLSYVENTGMAWGIMSGQRTLFVLLTLILTTFLLIGLWRLLCMNARKKKLVYWILEWDLVLLIAGALGNLYDRIKVGYVVDFLKTEFIDFPVFNIADCYVTISVILLFLMMMFFVEESDLDEMFAIRKYHIKKTDR